MDGRYHILKDAWILSEHGISKINVLSTINNQLKNDTSEGAKAYHLMHPQFIVGQEFPDSTDKQRKIIANTPPNCVHRQVVTGPVGDPLTFY